MLYLYPALHLYGPVFRVKNHTCLTCCKYNQRKIGKLKRRSGKGKRKKERAIYQRRTPIPRRFTLHSFSTFFLKVPAVGQWGGRAARSGATAERDD